MVLSVCSILLILAWRGASASFLLITGGRSNAFAVFRTFPRYGSRAIRVGTEDNVYAVGAIGGKDDEENDDDEAMVDPSALRSLTFTSLDASTEPQLLSDFLIELGACSTAITDHDRDTPDEVPIFREPDTDEDWAVVCGDAAVGRNVWRRCDVTAHFPATFDLRSVAEIVRETFDFSDTPRYVVGDVPDRDWVIHVQSSWKPIVVSGFVLRFPWHTDKDVTEAVGAAVSGGRVRKWGEGMDHSQLRLEGGIAFGTGEHPTTRLCLGFLRDAVESHGARTVLDYGAGSGVLGLAACTLSEDVEAVGVEIDVDAIQIANRNADTNGLNMRSYLPPARHLGYEGDSESASIVFKGQVRAQNVEALPSKWDGPVFDACAANILAGPLIGLTATISSMVRPGGHLGLSGVLKEQAEKVMEAYSEYFDNVKVAGEEGGWVLITGKRVAHCGMDIPDSMSHMMATNKSSRSPRASPDI